MAKISEVVKLKTGYANFVDLKGDFEKSQENADRMASYRRTKSHREALERLCRGYTSLMIRSFTSLAAPMGPGNPTFA